MDSERCGKKNSWPTLPGETEEYHKIMRCNRCP